jgi:hypothetical protein
MGRNNKEQYKLEGRITALENMLPLLKGEAKKQVQKELKTLREEEEKKNYMLGVPLYSDDQMLPNEAKNINLSENLINVFTQCVKMFNLSASSRKLNLIFAEHLCQYALHNMGENDKQKFIVDVQSEAVRFFKQKRLTFSQASGENERRIKIADNFIKELGGADDDNR